MLSSSSSLLTSRSLLYQNTNKASNSPLQSQSSSLILLSYHHHHPQNRFKKPEEAKKAIEQCNGFRLLDKPMKVGSSGFEPKFDNRVAIEELDGDEQHIRMNSQARLALMNRLSHRVGQPFPVPIPILAPIHPLHIPHPLHLQPHLQPHPHHPQAFIPIRSNLILYLYLNIITISLLLSSSLFIIMMIIIGIMC